MSELEPAGGDPDEQTTDLLAAALRSDAREVDTLVRVLASSLAETLPPAMVEVQRDRSLADRVGRRPGTPVAVTVTGPDVRLRLAAAKHHGGSPDAEVHRVVRGVTISRQQVGLDDWVQALATLITEQARTSAEARAALSRLLSL